MDDKIYQAKKLYIEEWSKLAMITTLIVINMDVMMVVVITMGTVLMITPMIITSLHATTLMIPIMTIMMDSSQQEPSLVGLLEGCFYLSLLSLV